MVARDAGRVDALSAVQREGVKPERHRLDSRASEDRVDLDRQQVSHLPLSLRNDEPLPRATLRRPRRPHHTPPLGPFLLAPPRPVGGTSLEACSVVDQRSGLPTRDGRQASGVARPAGR